MNLAKSIFIKYPIIRGMLTYSVIYPSSNIVQQTFIGPDELSLNEVAQFAIFGSCWVAPTLYTWIRIAGVMMPTITVASAIKKALIEQITYTPMAISTFYLGMNFLQGNNIEKGIEELKIKFLPTYSTGLLYWPIIQTINFTLVREKNRVSVVGLGSFLWVTFLSYMKHKKIKIDEAEDR